MKLQSISIIAMPNKLVDYWFWVFLFGQNNFWDILNLAEKYIAGVWLTCQKAHNTVKPHFIVVLLNGESGHIKINGEINQF